MRTHSTGRACPPSAAEPLAIGSTIRGRLFRAMRSVLASRVSWLVLFVTALTVMLLGAWGFMLHGESVKMEPALRWSTCLFLAVQLFVLNSGNVQGDVPWQLEVARWAAVAVSVLGLVKGIALVFRERLLLFFARNAGGHVVLCGLGSRGLAILRQLPRGVIVIAPEPKPEEMAYLRSRGDSIVVGTPLDRSALRRAGLARARWCISVLPDDALGLSLFALLQRHNPTGDRRDAIHLTSPSLIRQTEAVVAPGHTRPIIFSYPEQTARRLLLDHPLDGGAGIAADSATKVHLFVTGLGDVGREVLLRSLRMGHFANGSAVTATVVDPQAESLRHTLLAQYPCLAHPTLMPVEFMAVTADHPDVRARFVGVAQDRDTHLYVAVCVPSAADALGIALRLPPVADPTRVTVVVRQDESRRLLPAAGVATRGGYRIHRFGRVSRVLRLSDVLRGELDQLASQIHENYRREEVARGNHTIPSWADLSEMDRRSNRLQADHMYVKLRALGLRVVPVGQAKSGWTGFTDEQVEVLARTEHNRWAAVKMLEGFAPPGHDFGPQRKDLVPFEQLPEATKEKDRLPIRAIPNLLRSIGREVSIIGTGER